MRRILITTGGKEIGWSRHNEEGIIRDYDKEVDRLFESAQKFGLECIRYDDKYIYSRPYYPEHKNVMDKVSFGFTYKAIEMYETLKGVDYDDVVLLTDSNHVVQSDPSIFYDIATKEGAFIYNHLWVSYPNRMYTRRDTFVNMDCDEERYWNAEQMQINLMAFKKTDINLDFTREWFECCLDYKIMFGENKYPNFPDYRVHRHDQSIFSILREKYHFPYLHRGAKAMWAENTIKEMKTIGIPGAIGNIHRREADMEESV